MFYWKVKGYKIKNVELSLSSKLYLSYKSILRTWIVFQN